MRCRNGAAIYCALFLRIDRRTFTGAIKFFDDRPDGFHSRGPFHDDKAVAARIGENLPFGGIDEWRNRRQDIGRFDLLEPKDLGRRALCVELFSSGAG